MANPFLDELLRGYKSPIANSLSSEDEEAIRSYLGEPQDPQGMAASLPQRSGDIGMPEDLPELPEPMGMAESLRQRSGDDLPDTQAPTRAIAGTVTPDLFRKEDVVEDAAQVQQAQEQPTEDTDLAEATRKRDNLLTMMMMGKGAERIGTAISGTESDKSYLDLLKPMAESKVGDVLTKRKAEADKVDLDTKKFNYAFAKDKDDPKSPSSKFYRDTLKELASGAKIGLKIPENLSAAEMERIYPNIINIVNAKEAREARAAQVAIASGTKRQAAKEKTDDEKKKFTSDLRKELTSGQYGKLWANVNNAQKASESITKMMQDPSGYSDYSTLMSGLKALQGDESVVREAEIKLGISATDFKSKIQNQIDMLRKGTSLQPKQRQDILNTVKFLQETTTGLYKDAIQPQLLQAQEEGIDTRMLIPGNILNSSGQESSGMIGIRRKSDGLTKKVPASEAKKYLNDPKYEQVQ